MDDERLAELGRFIGEQRRRAGLSVRRLADMAGVSNPYLSQAGILDDTSRGASDVRSNDRRL